MREVIFLVQNLAHKTDSVGFDCISEYNFLRKAGYSVLIFADVFDASLHPGVDIRPFKGFYSFHKKHKDSTIIYHFCDGWIGLDDYLIEFPRNVYVRWHNNTPPWFYALDWPEFAKGGLRGFKIILQMLQTELRFLVNSDFTKRQLQALGGRSEYIYTVFPAGPLLEKEKIDYSFANRKGKDSIDILFVSRLVPHKGHKHILVIADILKRYLKKEVFVHFVGTIEERMRDYTNFLLREGEKRDISVCLHGVLTENELHSIYRESDIFMCMSEHEGFGMPVFEAMRCGIPVVVWSNTAFSDLLESHPFSSGMFDPYWFAAASVVAISGKAFSGKVASIQDRILKSYNKNNISHQLTSALESKDFFFSKIHEDSHLIYNEIRKIKEDIRKSVVDIKSYTFDTTLNYFSLYDIKIYDRLLSYEDEPIVSKPLVSDGTGFDKFSNILKDLDNISTKDLRSSINDVNELLLFDDECFVRAVFIFYGAQLSLDSGILKYFVRKLRNGDDKEDIINEISNFFDKKNLIKNKEFYSDMKQKISRMNENVSRIKRAILPYLVLNVDKSAISPGIDLDELLYLEDGLFIETAFLFILGRRVDEGAFKYYSEKLKNGLDRTAFLKGLLSSDEGKDNSSKKVYGVDALLDSDFGKVGLLNKKRVQNDLSRTLAQLENHIGRIVMGLCTNRIPVSVCASEISPKGLEDILGSGPIKD